MDTPRGKAAFDALVSGESRFIDLSASPLWFAIDYPQVATSLHCTVARIRSNVMRLIFALQPSEALSEEEARRYWLAEHGPLIRSHSSARGLLAYKQVHRCDCSLAEAFRSARGTTVLPFLGHAESWFERPSGAAPSPEMQAAMDAAIEDERKFIDWNTSTILVGKELVFVDREWVV